MISRCDEEKEKDSKIKEIVLRAVQYYFDGIEVKDAIEKAKEDFTSFKYISKIN